MLIASSSVWSTVAGIVTALVVGGVSGYFFVRGRKVATETTLADSAVSSLTGELAASNSRIDRLESENGHLKEINAQQKVLNESLSAQLQDIRQWVTARDLIEQLDDKVESGFREVLKRLPVAS